MTGIFKEVCRATGCSDSEMADLQEYFKRIPLDRQVKLVEVVGDLSDIAAEHEIQLRAVVRLYAHYNEVGSTRHAVERASEIAGSSNNEVYCGAVVNTMLRAFRNAAQNGSSVQEVERFIDEGDLRSLREVSRREAIA